MRWIYVTSRASAGWWTVSDPRTWSLLGDFTTCLGLIRVANGYFTDAGLYVTREPSQIPAAQGALIALALGGLARATDPSLTRTHRLATVLLVGKVGTGSNNEQLRLHHLLADVERALSGQQARFGAGRAFPSFVGATPIPPAKGMDWIGAEIRYSTHVQIG